MFMPLSVYYIQDLDCLRKQVRICGGCGFLELRCKRGSIYFLGSNLGHDVREQGMLASDE
jgi:hypothetical protein